MKVISLMLLSACLYINPTFGQANAPNIPTNPSSPSSEYFAKGGIGLIKEQLYIDLISDRNELILPDGKRWVGQNASTPEVILYFKHRMWSLQALPEDFDLSQSIVVSFESSKVRFFDFVEMSGGYYKRSKRD